MLFSQRNEVEYEVSASRAKDDRLLSDQKAVGTPLKMTKPYFYPELMLNKVTLRL